MSQGAFSSSRRRTLDCLPGTRRGRIAAGSTVAVVLLACTLALAFTLAPMASTTSEAGTNETREPVVVVGGGLAGLSAAIEIVRAGGSVVILEKTDRLGGNSAKASSGINAAGSAPQKAASIEDNPKDFAHDTQASGRGRSNAELVNLLAEKSASALQFLEDFGIDLSIISQLGGHSHPRTHRATMKDGKPMNVGFRIMSTLIAYLNDAQKEKPERVKILTNARVVKLVKDDAGGINGIVYVTKDAEGKEAQVTLAAGAVILATGGYSADADGLLKKHVPYYEGIPTTNGPFATGDGVRLGEAIGAETVDLDQVQLHPTGFVDPADPNSGVKFLAPEALRGVGGIMLDHRGQRFVDELATRDTVSHKMLHHCVHGSPSKHPALDIRGGSSHTVAHLILTQEAVDAFGAAAAGFYFFKKLLRKYDTLAELCEREGLPLGATEQTLKAYGRSGNPDPYGKTRFPVLFAEGEGDSVEVKTPLYASMVVPVLHYCMGGLKFDTQAHILGPGGAPIPGLFGAGEVTGGLHGANRLAGNSLLECVVFGRLAGLSALHYAGGQTIPQTSGTAGLAAEASDDSLSGL